MSHPVEDMRNEIARVLHLLEPGSLPFLEPRERKVLRDGAERFSRKLGDLERSFLTIGLLGGTGVGKSTLMNALAGSPIAHAGHRRPDTDRVLLYRHEEAPPLPRLPLGEAPWKEITHRGDPLRLVLLCDLPDFDSVAAEHRLHVADFLEHLDLLVWVTTPEKYADARFYEFLGLVPKARENYVFVLNKLDILFDPGDTDKGYGQAAKVLAAFQKHLEEHGIPEPLLYALSAEEAQKSGSLSVWNQFPAFRQFISQRRKAKEILSIKGANLHREMEELLTPLRKEEETLKFLDHVLERAVKGIREERELWMEEGRGAIENWLGQDLFREILRSRSDPSPLVGLGAGLAAMVDALRGRPPGEKGSEAALSLLRPPDRIALVFRKRMEWVENRFSREILREDIPPALREKIQGALRIAASWEDLGEKFLQAAAFHLLGAPGRSFRAFRVFQHLAYSGVLILLLFVLGGEKAWVEVLVEPVPSGLLKLLLSCIHSLFSPKGLAALGTYAVLNLILALRFYGLYRRTLSRSAGRLVETLKSALLKLWDACLTDMLQGIGKLQAEIRSRISALDGLPKG